MTKETDQQKTKGTSVKMGPDGLMAAEKLALAYGRNASVKYIVEQCVIQMLKLAEAAPVDRELPLIIRDLDSFRENEKAPIRFSDGSKYQFPEGMASVNYDEAVAKAQRIGARQAKKKVLGQETQGGKPSQHKP